MRRYFTQPCPVPSIEHNTVLLSAALLSSSASNFQKLPGAFRQAFFLDVCLEDIGGGVLRYLEFLKQNVEFFREFIEFFVNLLGFSLISIGFF